MNDSVDTLFSQLDSTSLHNSKLLNQYIIELSNQTPLTFSRYMQECLYHQQYGYYTAGQVNIANHLHEPSNRSDFITAPQVSELFSKVLAKQIIEYMCLHQQTTIVELGGGKGKMAQTIMHQLYKAHSLPTNYYIIDISPVLQSQQQHLSYDLPPAVQDKIKITTWEDFRLNNNTNVVVLANEFFDALPTEIVRYDNNHWQLQTLIWHENQWQYSPSIIPLTAIDEQLENWLLSHSQSMNGIISTGYQTEFNPNIKPWLAKIAAMTSTSLAIIIDYGYSAKDYYHPERSNGTVCGYFQHHQTSDILKFQGLQDITAHIDFSWLCYCAESYDYELLGYHTQADFLLNGGILEFAQQTTDSTQRLSQSQQIQFLIDKMGEVFRVAVFYKSPATDQRALKLSGLAGKDLGYSL